MNYKKIHYTYKIIDLKTEEYYIGSRSCSCNPEEDDYMGSYCAWTPEDETRLKKEIIAKYPTRALANSIERKLLIEKIKIEKDDKCMNAHIPSVGFHAGFAGKSHSDEWRKNQSERIFERNKKYGNPMTDMTGSLNPMHGRCAYNIWLEKYGKEKADELWIKRNNKISKAISGKNHYLFGVTGSANPTYGENNGMYNMTGSLNPMYGKKHTTETKRKIAKAQYKKVVHIKTGKVFESQIKAAEYFGISNQTVSRHCRGKRKRPKFEYSEE